MPGTDAVLEYCQKLQPVPAQFAAGSVGWLALVQCAIQSRYPARANQSVFAMEDDQNEAFV